MAENAPRSNRTIPCALGCLAVVVVLGVLGWLAVRAAQQAFYTGVAATVREAGREILGGLQLPEEESAAALGVIERFADRVEAGEVSLAQARNIAQALNQGPLPAYLTARAFELKYIEGADLAPEKAAAARQAVSRFAHGLMTGAVAQERVEEVLEPVTETTTDPQGKETKQLKASLTSEELDRALAAMREAADRAEIPQQQYEIDVAAALQDALDQGMADRAAPRPDDSRGRPRPESPESPR